MLLLLFLTLCGFSLCVTHTVMHFTGALHANFSRAYIGARDKKKTMRLINRAMGENAKLFMHISVPTGRDYEKLHVRRCEKIPNAQLFDNGTGESHFQGDCARRKRFLAALEWSWRFCTLTCCGFSSQLTFINMLLLRSEGSLLMHSELDWKRIKISKQHVFTKTQLNNYKMSSFISLCKIFCLLVITILLKVAPLSS